MQVTNVLRDVKEDWSRGRVYLPLQELAAFGLDEQHLARFAANEGPATPETWAAWRRFMAFQIARARAFDRRAQLGISHLTGFGSQSVVRLMSAVYGAILTAIERQHDDVFIRRAHIGFGEKVALAGRVLFSPHVVQGQSVEIPSLPGGLA
jgi:phytoene synthase